jgi:hypothetical protein
MRVKYARSCTHRASPTHIAVFIATSMLYTRVIFNVCRSLLYTCHVLSCIQQSSLWSKQKRLTSDSESESLSLRRQRSFSRKLLGASRALAGLTQARQGGYLLYAGVAAASYDCGVHAMSRPTAGPPKNRTYPYSERCPPPRWLRNAARTAHKVPGTG